MKRQVITGEPRGRWFDIEAAATWKEDTIWDGNNHISQWSRRQWDHSQLYRTASGQFVLHSWSQRQGVVDTWETVDDDTAVRWLAVNGHEPPAHLEAANQALEL